MRNLASIALLLPAMTVLAGDFDGSKPLICAPVTAMDCVRGDDCLTTLPEEVGAPAFMRIDFAKKAVLGAKLSSPIQLLEKTESQLLLQGTEAEFGWTMALDARTGEMTLTLASQNGAYVLFGSCTPL
jgi:hypothetical protein